MPTLNLGIVAHVDAGKTTLTERLLFETGVTERLGRVDHGDTTTDADALERQRGITIRSAVVTFTVPSAGAVDVKVNLIDTPGHSDFVAEVERALAVLDGAVLVVSAVEGVQAQTRVLIRILERLHIPFLVFANKIDRVGAAYERTMDALREALAGDAIALNAPTSLGSRVARVRARRGTAFLEELVERLTEYDDGLLSQYVDGVRPPTQEQALHSLVVQTRHGRLHPVLFGSALGGIGVTDVIEALPMYLPTTDGNPHEPLHASVFKIERGPAGHKVAYARLHSGTLTPRDHVVVHHRAPSGTIAVHEARAMSVNTFDHAAATVGEPARAGDIATILGITDIGIGDQLGRWDPARGGRHFPPPGLEAVVKARDPAERSALFQALQQLSEQDPLINARLDGIDQEITVSVYGEVQKEVLAARLESEYGVVADLLPTRTVYVERVAGIGQASAQVRTGNATVGLRIEPGAVGSGLDYSLAVERGYLLPHHHVAIEETLPRALETGLLGWRVVDARVVLIEARFCAPTPPAGYYRDLTQSVLAEALACAGTIVCAPVSEFEAEIPDDVISAVLQRLHACSATPQPPAVAAGRCCISGLIPTDRVDAFEQRLPGLTRGEGVFFARPVGYEPVVGEPPSRTRSASASTGSRP